MDREARNCCNFRGLSEEARAVDGYTAAITEELKRKRCLKVLSIGDIRLYECPLSYFDEETQSIIGLVFRLEGAGLPYFDGGLASQPCWLMEAVEIFENERSAREGKGNG
ncbi:MAG: hypothetical protein HS130_12555 [Deltaproteobacteria bacterium]|nr:hypothetical protein [Deltaproteobacteria bacterium]MCL4874670.1 hypothetical protein [bacterium]